jgi:hypothetical protein
VIGQHPAWVDTINTVHDQCDHAKDRHDLVHMLAHESRMGKHCGGGKLLGGIPLPSVLSCRGINHHAPAGHQYGMHHNGLVNWRPTHHSASEANLGTPAQGRLGKTMNPSGPRAVFAH